MGGGASSSPNEVKSVLAETKDEDLTKFVAGLPEGDRAKLRAALAGSAGGVLAKIAVLGATGQQGGAVVHSLVSRGKSVVAITRNTDSDRAKELSKLEKVEVRKADLEDVASLEAAFAGCDGAFVLANFWEGMDVTKEMRHYKNAAEALKKVGSMKHIVFSTLEDTASHASMAECKVLLEHESGAMKVPHFDGKNRSHKFFDGLPITFLVTSCYIENFTSFFSLSRQEDGSYMFTLPLKDVAIAWTILEDVGNMAAGIFEHPELVGKTVGSASAYLTGKQLAEAMSSATGKTVKYNEVSWETFAGFGFPGAHELGQMFKFFTDNPDCNKIRDLKVAKEIGGDLQDVLAKLKSLPLKFEG